jgi:exopolyphosphatase/pppGpp-phosphohydrolase
MNSKITFSTDAMDRAILVCKKFIEGRNTDTKIIAVGTSAIREVTIEKNSSENPV